MLRFRSKPREIEAAQYFGGGAPLPPGVCIADHEQPRTRSGMDHAHVHTAHHQQVYLEVGDWVVAEPDDRGYYPVKADIFRRNWERIEEGEGK